MPKSGSRWSGLNFHGDKKLQVLAAILDCLSPCVLATTRLADEVLIVTLLSPCPAFPERCRP